jgi:CheY-like chemotaxis protein
VVSDGEECLNYLHHRGEFTALDAGNPAVILLDLKMPKVNGLQVLEEVRASEKQKLIPIVIMTSSTEHQDLVNSYRLAQTPSSSNPSASRHLSGPSVKSVIFARSSTRHLQELWPRQ